MVPLAALLLLVAGAEPGPPLLTSFASGLQLTLSDDNGPPPGSPYPPPPPLVQDPPRWNSSPPPQPPPADSPPAYPPPAYTPPAYSPPPQAPAPYSPQPGYSLSLPPLAPVSTAPPVADVGGRLMFGIGLHLGGAEDQFVQSSPVGLGIGIYLRLGFELNDTWGVEGELSAGTLFVVDYVREAITVDLSPVDWFTFAFGPVLREDVDALVDCSCGTCATSVTESVGGTVRADFHILPDRSASGRSGFTLGIAGDLGASVGSNIDFGQPGVAFGLYLTLGYARY